MIIIIAVTVSIIELSTNLNKITSIKIFPSTDLLLNLTCIKFFSLLKSYPCIGYTVYHLQLDNKGLFRTKISQPIYMNSHISIILYFCNEILTMYWNCWFGMHVVWSIQLVCDLIVSMSNYRQITNLTTGCSWIHWAIREPNNKHTPPVWMTFNECLGGIFEACPGVR